MREMGECLQAETHQKKRRQRYGPVRISASRSTTFCHVSKCARLTLASGLFFDSGYGGSSSLIDFS
jgi:hypothetical protein